MSLLWAVLCKTQEKSLFKQMIHIGCPWTQRAFATRSSQWQTTSGHSPPGPSEPRWDTQDQAHKHSTYTGQNKSPNLAPRWAFVNSYCPVKHWWNQNWKRLFLVWISHENIFVSIHGSGRGKNCYSFSLPWIHLPWSQNAFLLSLQLPGR